MRSWPPEIIVADDSWDADLETVDLVLSAAGNSLWRYFSPAETDPVLVYPRGGPLTLYERGPRNEHIVKLDTGGTYWAQYVFQFAHELCHILVGMDRTNDTHRWFEESICELASLFVLRRMSRDWNARPPYPHWQQYAIHLWNYASARMEIHPPPAPGRLPDWYAEIADAQGRLPPRRELCTAVAASLLGQFEQTPDCWDAVSYLHTNSKDQASKAPTFQAFLNRWYAAARPQQQEFIRTIGNCFAIEVDGVIS